MGITRRHILISAGLAVSGLGTAASGASKETSNLQDPQSPANRKMKIVVSGGHPGDPEYGCGGTVARMTALGHEVVLLYLNNGSNPPIPVSPRMAEAARACKILNARPAYAGQEDDRAVVDSAHYAVFQKLIAAENPDAVFTQ